jgi:thioredoxin reductase
MYSFLSRDGHAPHDPLAIGRAEVQGYGGRLIDGRVTGITTGTGTGLRVRLADGPALSTRRVLIATGLRDELPNLPGVRERWGRDLLHCPYCHGYEVRDQPVGVLGGTSEAVGHAQLVRQWSADVVLSRTPTRSALTSATS